MMANVTGHLGSFRPCPRIRDKDGSGGDDKNKDDQIATILF